MQILPIYTKIQATLTIFVLLVNLIWISIPSIKFYYSKSELVMFIVLLLALYLPYWYYKKFRPDTRIMTALLSTFFFLSFSFFVFVLSYLTYTLNLPLFDQTFDRWDRFFGFHALDLILWFHDHPWMYFISGEIYNTYYYQLPLVIFYFSFFVNTNDLQRFILLFMIAAILTIFISTFCPSITTYGWYGYTPDPHQARALGRIYELRSSFVNITKGDGIIEFPSFHTAVALIYIYMFRKTNKLIFVPILILNCLMIFTCLIHGGHYLVDLFGGGVVFIVTIAIEQRLNIWAHTREMVEKIRASTAPASVPESKKYNGNLEKRI